MMNKKLAYDFLLYIEEDATTTYQKKSKNKTLNLIREKKIKLCKKMVEK